MRWCYEFNSVKRFSIVNQTERPLVWHRKLWRCLISLSHFLDLLLSAKVTSSSTSSCFHPAVLKRETTLCEWRVQTPPLESDYNKHFSLPPHALPNTRVLLEQAFTSASSPALLDLRPLTSFKIRGWRTSLLPLVFTQQVEGWAAPVILLERLLLSRAAKVDWLKKDIHVKFSCSFKSSRLLYLAERIQKTGRDWKECVAAIWCVMHWVNINNNDV